MALRALTLAISASSAGGAGLVRDGLTQVTAIHFVERLKPIRKKDESKYIVVDPLTVGIVGPVHFIWTVEDKT